MKVVVYTLGCKVNQYESEEIIEEFRKNNIKASSIMQKADCYIINTCAVTLEAERKSRQITRRAFVQNPKAIVFACGCASKNCDSDKFGGATIIKGLKQKKDIVKYVINFFQDSCDKKDNIDFIDSNNDINVYNSENKKDIANNHSFEITDAVNFNYTFEEKNKTRKFIKIQDGCNNFCSYCIIPRLRGRSTSVDENKILDEIKSSKAKEIVLTAINLSSYGLDNGSSLAKLAEKIGNITDARVRLGSIEINVIDKKLLEVLKKNNFCNHFHLSMQSASNDVLRAMNRRYTIEDFIKKVYLIREVFDDNVGITTDIIVGYPTETDENHRETISNLEKIRFSDMHIFKFSSRPGTVASKLTILSSDIVTNRFNDIEEIRKKHYTEFMKKQINSIQDVYFETYDGNMSKGYSSNYCLVKAFEDYSNDLKKVKIKSFDRDCLISDNL